MKKGIFILITMIVFGCSSNDENLETTDLQFMLIGKGNLYGNGDEEITKQNLVITNQNGWDTLISQMNSVNTVSAGFSETEINFLEYTIIAVFDEIRGNGGHSLELEISSNSNNISVKTVHTHPGSIATTVITQPYIIVKIPKLKLPIIFE